MILDRINISEIKGPVYIAPAGCVGFATYHALRRYGIEVVGFCDNNKGMAGKNYDNCPILSPEVAVSQNPNATFVIATIHYRVELAEQFRGLGADKLLYAGQFITQDIFSEALEDLNETAARTLTNIDAPKAIAANNAEPFWLLEPRLDINYSGCMFFPLEYYSDYVEAFKQWFGNISAKYETFDSIIIHIDNTADVIKQILIIVLYLKEHLKTPTKRIVIQSYYSDKSSLLISALQEELISAGIQVKSINAAELYKTHLEKYHTTNIPITIYAERPYSDEENKYNCVFTHIPKNAGTSMIIMMEGQHSHHKLALHCKMFDAEKFNKYFKFAIVRNPWDWLVSMYFFFHKAAKSNQWTLIDRNLFNPGSWIRYSTFRDYILDLKNIKVELQSDWICDEESNIIIDYVGRLENLPESIRYIREKLGMESDVPLLHENASKHKHYTEYYDEEMIEIVRDVFKRDIELFGYEFGKHPGPDIIINSREDFVPVSKR